MIYLVRHGQVPANERRVLVSRSDEPLSEVGRKQAEKAAEGFQARGICFDRVICSPMTRAIQTATYLAPGVAIEAIETDARLCEVDFASLEGTECAEVKAAFDQSGTSISDGESLHDLRERVSSFLSELAPEAGNLLIVSHGTTIRCILSIIQGIPVEELFRIQGPQNLGVQLLLVEETGDIRLVAENVVF